jgi:hypothetical protein
MMMMTMPELRESAVRIRRELDAFQDQLEHSGNSPYIKSSLGREISESRARLDQIILACAAPAA